MEEKAYDLILRHGQVVDGSGKQAFAADVAIQGERIAEVGQLEAVRALKEIDVSGRIVAPGFIDVHTHDDAALIETPDMLPKLTQGVTTVIAGNCGVSGAPFDGTGQPSGVLKLIFKSRSSFERRFEEFLSKVQKAAPAVNAAFLVGHTTLRMQVMANDLLRSASRSEMRAMRELLSACLKEGALGLSTGLFYAEARAASTEEVIETARPLSEYGGLYVTHVRDEADGVMKSIHEALSIGREVGTDVIISHHKCMGQRNFGRSVETLSLLETASKTQGVAWDVYPYTAASTVLNEELVAKAARTVITWSDPRPDVNGLELAEIARLWNCSVTRAVGQLQPAGAIYFLMDEADVQRIMSSRNAMIGSDGIPADKHPHPRLWGTFPRVLGRYVRERGLLTLEEGVRRMTGFPAERFALHLRGLVRAGYYGDLCVFDAQKILDTATYERPETASVGIDYVFVNGHAALAHGRLSTSRAGKVLRRSDSACSVT